MCVEAEYFWLVKLVWNSEGIIQSIHNSHNPINEAFRSPTVKTLVLSLFVFISFEHLYTLSPPDFLKTLILRRSKTLGGDGCFL